MSEVLLSPRDDQSDNPPGSRPNPDLIDIPVLHVTSPESPLIDSCTVKDNSSVGGIYQCEGVRGKKKVRGKWHYLVKWHGYSEQESTWEPLANLVNCGEFIEAYESAQREKARKRQTGSRNNSFVVRELTANGGPGSTASSQNKPKKQKRSESLESQSVSLSSEPLGLTAAFTRISEQHDAPEPKRRFVTFADEVVGGSLTTESEFPVSVFDFDEISKSYRTNDKACSTVNTRTTSQSDNRIPLPILQSSASDGESMAKLRRLAPAAVKVVGVSLRDSVPSTGCWAVVHFHSGPENWLESFPLAFVKEVLMEKLLDYYQTFARIVNQS